MQRRQFLKQTAQLALFVPALPFVTNEDLSVVDSPEAQAIARLEAADTQRACQTLDHNEYALALKNVNPKNEPGLLASSVGCKSPHKHLVFIPARYLSSPDLIEAEATVMLENGLKAKSFQTSFAFDMSLAIQLTVERHVHELYLTRQDLITIAQNADGVKRIAFQHQLLDPSKTEPGHVFHLKL